MHLSQAALSGLVKELESRLGVRLLDRNTRSVSASVVGTAFEPMVRRVLADLDEALENVTNLKELRRGLVRVDATETDRKGGVEGKGGDVRVDQGGWRNKKKKKK